MTAFGRSDPYRTSMIFARLLKLSDEDVREGACAGHGRNTGGMRLSGRGAGMLSRGRHDGAWQADDTFFDLIRDRAVTNALLPEIAGKAVADGNLSEKTKLQKQMIRDCLASTNGRAKIETWLPRWLSFPPRNDMER